MLVLEQPNVPPLQWPLGVIDKIYLGKDNVIRAVDVRTNQEIFKRPIVKVCPLPTQ